MDRDTTFTAERPATDEATHDLPDTATSPPRACASPRRNRP